MATSLQTIESSPKTSCCQLFVKYPVVVVAGMEWMVVGKGLEKQADFTLHI